MKVGYTWTRKAWEYTVVAKVPHSNYVNLFVYMIEQRELGQESVTYYTDIQN